MNRERFCRETLHARALAAANFLHHPTRFQNVARGNQARHSSAFRRLHALVILACSGFITTSALAHPHVWATIKTELIYAPDASVTAVHESRLAGSTSEGIVRPQNNAAAWATAIDWLICRRLSCRRCRAANQGTNLAGDAGVTRSLLGQSEFSGIY